MTLDRVVEAVGALDLDLQLQAGDHALEGAGLGDQAVDALLHQSVALGVALADHLVIGLLAAVGLVLDRLESGERGVDLDGGFVRRLRRERGGVGGDRGAFDHRAVDAGVLAAIDRGDADLVIIMRVVGVVGEAVVLLLRIVEDEAELHALAGEFAIRERAEAGEDDGEAGLVLLGQHRLAGLALGGPIVGHLLEVGDQEISRGLEVGGAALAIAAGAVLGVVVAGGALAGAGPGAVQVLAPEQEFDGVIAGGDVGFDAARLLQALQQLRRDLRGVDGLLADADLGVGDHIGGVERVLVRLLAIALGVDIVDQPLVERPGIHLALPVIDDGVAEAIALGLLVRHARRLPGRLGLVLILGGRRGRKSSASDIPFFGILPETACAAPASRTGHPA